MENTFQEIKLAYNPIKYGKVTSSSDIEKFFRLNWGEEIHFLEEFKVVLFNSNMDIIGYRTIGRGGLTEVNVDLRVIFSIALKSLATGIVLAHNHPSGKMSPSSADRQLTENIKVAGELLRIRLLDHVILHPDLGYYSFADEGLL